MRSPRIVGAGGDVAIAMTDSEGVTQLFLCPLPPRLRGRDSRCDVCAVAVPALIVGARARVPKRIMLIPEKMRLESRSLESTWNPFPTLGHMRSTRNVWHDDIISRVTCERIPRTAFPT